MTLFDILQVIDEDEEVTVCDRDYDIEFYAYNVINSEDAWDKAMIKIAMKLEVVRLSVSSNAHVVVNLCDVIERNLQNEQFKGLFKDCSLDSIMDDIEAIFAGNVSEKWLADFADSLQ